jgi:hypothetical protein
VLQIVRSLSALLLLAHVMLLQLLPPTYSTAVYRVVYTYTALVQVGALCNCDISVGKMQSTQTTAHAVHGALSRLMMEAVVCTVVLLLLYDVDSWLDVNGTLACKLLYLAESTSIVSESRRCATDSASSSDCAVACLTYI